MSHPADAGYFGRGHNESILNLQLESGGGKFCLYFQPQVVLGRGSITVMEALIRCDHPTKGSLLADDIIHFADPAFYTSSSE